MFIVDTDFGVAFKVVVNGINHAAVETARKNESVSDGAYNPFFAGKFGKFYTIFSADIGEW